MSSGRLGSADLSAATNTTIFTAAASKLTAFNVSICNRGDVAATVRLALCDTGTPGNDEYIEYDVSLSPNAVLERTGLVLDASKLCVAYSDVANVSVVAWGVEEDV